MDSKAPETKATDPEALRNDQLSIGKGDILGTEHVNIALEAKMRLINDAIDEIGMTGYQWKLFVLNGFGYVSCELVFVSAGSY